MRQSETVFHRPSEFFDHLLAGLERAEHSIDMEYYIFHIDELGQKVLDALERAAQRGVRVRLLVDGFGSSAWTLKNIRDLKDKNVRARIFRPFSQLFRKSLWFLIRLNLSKFAEFFFMLNRRNHRKLCIVDSHEYWSGSMNVSMEHQGWRETGLHIVSPSEARFLRNLYDWAWRSAPMFRFIKRHPSSLEAVSKNIRLNQTLKQRRDLYAEFLQSILFAKKRVWITNPYFVPDYSFIKAIKWVSQRGCDVRLLVPLKSDVAFFPHVSALFYEQLLKAGVKIYEYNQAILHAKIRIMDDQVWVGTSNLNSRSLLHDLELEIRLDDPKNNEEIARRFEQDALVSHEMTLPSLACRSLGSKAFGYCSLLIRYWL